MKKFLATLMTLVCVIGCMFALASCGDEQAESVALNNTELTHEVGAEETLTATVSPETAVNKAVTWESSAPEIASVDGGKVTAKAAGTATITAKTINDKSATCTVTVKLTLTEQTDFASLKSDKVTETQWKAAFSENSLVNCTVKHTNEHYKHTVYLNLQKDGKEKKSYVKDIEDTETWEFYVATENGKNFGYEKYDDSVERYEFTSEEDLEEFNLFLSYSLLLPDFGAFYGKFTYDGQANAYTYHGDESIEANAYGEFGTEEYVDITVKITGGKVAYVSCYRAGDDNEGHHGDGLYEFFVYDYGKTTVTLPTDFTVAE